MIVLALAAPAAAQVQVQSVGEGERLELRRAPAPEGAAGIWVRCTWTERRSDGVETSDTCGLEGQLGWSWADRRWAVDLVGVEPEPACPEASALRGSRWSGHADAAGVLGDVALAPPLHLQGRPIDLVAEVGDALQRLIVPLPTEKVRSGATWTTTTREEASGLTATVTQTWVATAGEAGPSLAWTERAELPEQVVGGRTVEATVEGWSGTLVHEPEALLPFGRWTSERPLRVVQGDRWLETVARCEGEVRRPANPRTP